MGWPTASSRRSSPSTWASRRRASSSTTATTTDPARWRWSVATPASPGSSSSTPWSPACPRPAWTSSACGCCPTPGVAYFTDLLGADVGVVISASHNPMPDNGIKFLAHGGVKLDDALRARDRGACWTPTGTVRRAARSAGSPRTTTRIDQYAAYLVGTIDHRLDGLRIVLDCANGAASEVGPQALREAGAEVVAICAEPDGLNINDGLRLDPSRGPAEGGRGARSRRRLRPRRRRRPLPRGRPRRPGGRRRPDPGHPRAGDARRRCAAPRHRRGHRDEQPRLRPGHARGGHRACCRPRWATATCWRR